MRIAVYLCHKQTPHTMNTVAFTQAVMIIKEMILQGFSSNEDLMMVANALIEEHGMSKEVALKTMESAMEMLKNVRIA
jgi:uncharacterized protein YoaH (UPF0181 family)